MTKRIRSVLVLVTSLVAGLTPTAVLPEPGEDLPTPVVKRPENIAWETLASGVRMAVLLGDRSKPGPFVLRLEYPSGYRKAPHVHPNDAYVTVLSGAYFRAYGTTFDESRGIELIGGTFSLNPAGVPHYEWVPEKALIEVHATGPWTTSYVDEAGAPTDAPHDPSEPVM